MAQNEPQQQTDRPLRIGISRCLLGEEVRFDGGHKRDTFFTKTLSRFVEWVPVCPEVEAGLGVPREAMRLVGTADSPKLLTIRTQHDHTDLMMSYSAKRIREFESEELDGFVFKKDSPSCGVDRVRIYNESGMPNRKGSGLFAGAFTQHFPLIPVEEEGRLNDPPIRENFIECVFGYHRRRLLNQRRLSRGAFVKFHTAHKLLLLAHSRPHYQKLGQLVAKAEQYTLHELGSRYGSLFMEGLRSKGQVNCPQACECAPTHDRVF